MDKRLAQALQAFACGIALAFVADEWTDHALRDQLAAFVARHRVEAPEPEPAVEIQPAPGEVSAVIAQANRITRRGV